MLCFPCYIPPERETHNVEIKDDVISLEDLASYSILGKLPGFPCKLNYLISQTTRQYKYEYEYIADGAKDDDEPTSRWSYTATATAASSTTRVELPSLT